MGAIGPLILKAVPWKFIFGLFVKVVLHFISKNEDKIEAKKAFLKFVDELKHDAPVKLNRSYHDQIRALKDELKLEETMNRAIKEEAKAYKEAYEQLQGGEDGIESEIDDTTKSERVQDKI